MTDATTKHKVAWRVRRLEALLRSENRSAEAIGHIIGAQADLLIEVAKALVGPLPPEGKR